MAFGRDIRVNLLIGTGHFLSHFYMLCLPPLFLVWQRHFEVSFAALGLSIALMSGVTAVLQTPVGFLVDRQGARRFLVGGTLLMTLSIGAMGFATAFWQVLVLAMLSGVGNSVIHPADYAILSGSVNQERMGRAFALHTFAGNLGSAAAPPAIALLLVLIGWRGALVVVGSLGIPMVAAILLQSRILQDQARHRPGDHGMDRGAPVSSRALLLNRTMLLFFAFYLLGAMAGAGLQSWLVTVLREVKGIGIEAASAALTATMVGNTLGVLVGGAVADRTKRVLLFATLTTIAGSALIFAVGVLSMGAALATAFLFCAGIAMGASRTPRDVMLKDAAPPGQIGKVFGFVSAGLPLGSAITPVPFGFLIDHHRPDLVLVLVAAVLLASIFCVGTAKATASARPVPAAAE